MATRTPPLQPRSQFSPYWGAFATAADLPNASGAPLGAPFFSILEVGDTAYSVADGATYTCTNVGTAGGGDAVWSSGGGAVAVDDLLRTSGQAVRAWLPIGANNNNVTLIGLIGPGGTGSSARAYVPGSAVYLERQMRVGFATSAASNSVISQRGAIQFAKNQSFRAKFVVAFGGTAIGTGRFLACFANTTAQYFSGATEPSSLALSLVGIALDSTDTNVQLIHNDGALACTKIDLGAAFARTANMVLEVLLSFTDGGDIAYRVRRLDAAGEASGTIGADIPADDTGLAFGFEAATDASGIASALLDFLGLVTTGEYA